MSKIFKRECLIQIRVREEGEKLSGNIVRGEREKIVICIKKNVKKYVKVEGRERDKP